MADPPAKVLFQTEIGELPLSRSAKLVGWSLCSFMRPDGLAWPSVAAIARRAGCGTTMARRALRELEEARVLTAQQRSGKAALYLATPTPWSVGVGEDTPTPLRVGGATPWSVGHPNALGVAEGGLEGEQKGSRGRATPARFVPDDVLIAAKNAEAAPIIDALRRATVKGSNEGEGQAP